MRYEADAADISSTERLLRKLRLALALAQEVAMPGSVQRHLMTSNLPQHLALATAQEAAMP